VIVIFYLGHGCLHCAEQLQAFAPRTADFQNAGISLIAISTDELDDLKKSHQRYKEGAFPFPLVSDDALVAFKLYQAFDDFEKVPLHGTFLIDAEGRIRWHDLGAEPFMNVNFLWTESRRLLFPNQVDPVAEPELLDDNRPADALDPLNVFPSPSPAPSPSTPPAKTTATGG
jgi:peroxiredoxin